MKQIQPVNTWKNGEVKTANYLDLRIIADDLKASATMYYELKDLQTDINGIEQHISISDGNISIEGQEYENWGTTVDVNTDAYNIAASKLNLTLI